MRGSRTIGISSVLLVLAFAGEGRWSAAQAQSTDRKPTNPETEQFVTSDIEHFWRAFDNLANARSRADSLRALFEYYYIPASRGLEAWIAARVGSPFNLLGAIDRAPKFYSAIRPYTLNIATHVPEMRRSVLRLKAMYPEAIFPDVYFLIGILNSGGTTADAGLLIGSELYARGPDVPLTELGSRASAVQLPSNVACTAVHELIHAQQKSPVNSLLGQVLFEGGADFATELTCGASANDDIHGWADARERELWSEFQHDLDAAPNSPQFTKWLYGWPTDRPKDLGYWMGYKITKAYYDRAPDKHQALKDIFAISDPSSFLTRSGYAGIGAR